MWLIFAFLSALFAAATSILGKIGVEGVNSNLATAIRTAVILIFASGIVLFTGAGGGIGDIGRRSWLFLILSGIATGISWLCYYRALQLGEASKVAPVDKFSIVITLILAALLLREKLHFTNIFGAILITAGMIFMIL